MRNLLLIIFLVANISNLLAQGFDNVTNIGIEQSLSNNFVTDMAADDDGFVWVVTDNGLNRITGYQNFPLNMNDAMFGVGSLYCVCYDPSSNKVWIGSYKGIATYDCKTHKFSKVDNGNKYNRNITDIKTSTDGGIWICLRYGYVQYYSNKTGKFTTYDFTRYIKNGCDLLTAIDDGNNHLFIGTTYGLIVYSMKTHETKIYHHEEGDSLSLPNDQIRTIFIDHLHNIWVGTKGGVGLFSMQTGKFIQLRHNSGNANSLCGDNIFRITEMRDHTLWIAADLGGISILNLDKLADNGYHDFNFTNLNSSNSNISSSSARSVVQDRYGNIWVGNYGTGVDFINSSPKIFNLLSYPGEDRDECVYSLDIDSDGSIWMGGESCVKKIKAGKMVNSWNIGHYKSEIYAVKVDSHGMVWLGLNDVGVVVLNPSNGKLSKLDVIGNNDTHAFVEDRNGRMWIGSDAGLFSAKDGKVTAERFMSSKLSSQSIYSLAFDKKGRLWVATMGGGIYVFNQNRQLVKTLSVSTGFPTNNISQIILDSDGGIWASTYEGLIYIPNVNTPDKYKLFGISQGLADKHLRAIAQDRMGNIWVSSYTDLSCFDVNKRRFYNYRSFVPEGSFFQGGAAVAVDGSLYFCSRQGVCYFNPSLIRNDATVSSVKFVAFTELVGTDSGQPLQFTPDKGNVVTLRHDENNFMIAFTVSDYSQIHNVDYQYQMKGLKDEWFDSNDGQVSFRGLAAGNYVFKVRAKLRSQDWDKATEAKVKIHVLPPFWLSWWAKLIYLLLAVAAMFLFFRSYKRKLKMQGQLELERKENEQRQEINEERLRFFTNITHELRTPLTLIIGPLEDLVNDSGLQDVYRKKIKIINNAAVRLLELVNGLLEFRKTETHNRQLIVSKGDITSVVKETGLRFKELNRNKDVNFVFHIDENIPKIYFDREVITTILNNLLSNAVKYTPKGSITVSVSRHNDDISIIVSDSGYGISEEALPHIFERYYQANGKRQASGTGIGLALVKSLAELHHASLTVKSKTGEGSCFCLTLNAGDSYPEALHKEEIAVVKPKEPRPTEEITTEPQKPLLLVVEDNDDIRQYISDSLGNEFEIAQSSNGKDGVEMAQERVPDIIVSDIMMPIMDGIELTRILKNDVRTSHIPIILLTAKDTISDKEEGYDSGADSYLTKPFSAKLLRIRIRNLLENRKRLQALLTGALLVSETEPPKETLSKLDRKFIEKLDKTIDENMMSDNLNIDFLTDIMAMSRATFYRKMKALTGLSAMEYIRKKRLQYAASLLRSGEHNINEAAMLSGFNNMGYFRDSFRQEFGMLPSDFLKKH